MPHIHWVTRQDKLEIPKDKDEMRTSVDGWDRFVQFTKKEKKFFFSTRKASKNEKDDKNDAKK